MIPNARRSHLSARDGRQLDRRHFLVGAMAAGLAVATAGRATAQTPGAATPAAASGDWTFTDDRDVTVVLPAPPASVVAQTSSAAALWDYGYRVAGIFGPSRTPTGEIDGQVGNIDLDAVTVVGDFQDLDVEALIALGAELYIDLVRGGDLWYLPAAEYPQVLDVVQTIGMSGYRDPVLDSIDRFGELAIALGAPAEHAPAVEARAQLESALEALGAAASARPGLRVAALSVSAPGEDVYIANPGPMTDLQLFRDRGLDILQPSSPDLEPNDYWQVIAWEEIGTIEADVIITDSRVPVDTVSGDTLWDGLPAVAAGQIGPWYATFPFSPQGFLPAVTELVELIERSEVLS